MIRTLAVGRLRLPGVIATVRSAVCVTQIDVRFGVHLRERVTVVAQRIQGRALHVVEARLVEESASPEQIARLAELQVHGERQIDRPALPLDVLHDDRCCPA